MLYLDDSDQSGLRKASLRLDVLDHAIAVTRGI